MPQAALFGNPVPHCGNARDLLDLTFWQEPAARSFAYNRIEIKDFLYHTFIRPPRKLIGGENNEQALLLTERR